MRWKINAVVNKRCPCSHLLSSIASYLARNGQNTSIFLKTFVLRENSANLDLRVISFSIIAQKMAVVQSILFEGLNGDCSIKIREIIHTCDFTIKRAVKSL